MKPSTLAETLIIPDTTKTEFTYCFIYIVLWKTIQKLLCEMQVDFIFASKNTRTNVPSGRIIRNHSSALALKPKVYYACALRAV